MFKKFRLEKSLIYVLIGAVLIVFVFVLYLFFSHGVKSIQILSPDGGEEWQVGKTYQIKWKARGIKRIGIVLFHKKEAKWIAKNINARARKYNWKIYLGQEYGDGYWIAIFEYPWKKGNQVSYSSKSFAIIYPKSIGCDDISLDKEWPYFPSDRPGLRKIFITENKYTGNLGGLKGADNKCQQEAEKQGFKGKWQAFLGGDKAEESAIERMRKTPRGTEGIFVEAKPSVKLVRNGGITCHRLLGKNFNEFLKRLSSPFLVNQEKINKEFLNNLKDIWLGRIDEKSKKNCIPISEIISNTYKPLMEKYTFTVSCQNWNQEKKFVEGYPVKTSKNLFPTCYTPNGVLTNAVALGGLAEGLDQEKDIFTPHQGKSCDSQQKLLCIEE